MWSRIRFSQANYSGVKVDAPSRRVSSGGTPLLRFSHSAKRSRTVSAKGASTGCCSSANRTRATRSANRPACDRPLTLPGRAAAKAFQRLAAGLFAELGDPTRRRAIRRLTSYGGLAPRLKQTGGPEKEARTRGVSRRANYTLRNLLFLLAHQIDQHGHPELRADYARRRDAGQRVQFTMARRMLRIVLHVLDHRDFFVPPSLVHSPEPDTLRQHYVSTWRPLLYKWRNAGAIRQAFTPGNPLEDWRTLINETHHLNLSNLSPQAADEPEG